MLNLIAASAYFLLIHFGVSGTKLRDTLVARLGEGPYRGAFALASLLGLVWMGYAYRHAPTIPLWGLLLGFRPAAYVLVLIALIFVVIGIATPSPTRVGMESKACQQFVGAFAGPLSGKQEPELQQPETKTAQHSKAA